MKLNDKEFNLLVELESGNIEQDLDDTTKLKELGLINKELKVTEKGYEYLEPFRVKKALFMAAGFGSRMVPITLERPKPLVRVNGQRIIDRLLDALLALDINDITIVRGYMKESMDELLEDYPMIKFVDNDDYDIANNISSMDLVKDEIGASYVLESDLVLYNPKVIKKYARDSHYFGIPIHETDDWVLESQNGYITEMKQTGRNSHLMVGVSYWNEKDGLQLSKDVDEFYKNPENSNKFWDQVPLEAYKDNYKVKIHDITKEDIVEIDTYEELKEIDKSYQ